MISNNYVPFCSHKLPENSFTIFNSDFPSEFFQTLPISIGEYFSLSYSFDRKIAVPNI